MIRNFCLNAGCAGLLLIVFSSPAAPCHTSRLPIQTARIKKQSPARALPSHATLPAPKNLTRAAAEQPPLQIITQGWDMSVPNDWGNLEKETFSYTYNQTYRLDNYTYTVWTPAKIWLDTFKTVYSYVNNEPTEVLSTVCIYGGTFVDYEKSLYTYQPTTGYLVETLKKDNFAVQGISTSLGEGLHDSLRITSIHNADGTPKEDTIRTINPVTWTLANNTIITYAHTAGKLTGILYRPWNDSLQTWEIDSKVTMTYNAKGLMTEEMTQLYEQNTYVNYERYLYTYDTNDSLIKDEYQYFENGWLPDNQYLFTYGPFGKTSSQYQYFTTTWQNSSQTTAHYTAAGKPDTMTVQDWDGATGWVNYYRLISSYNGLNVLTEERYETWNDVAWEKYSRLQYYYTTGIHDKNHTPAPQPPLIITRSADNLIVQLSLSQPSRVSLRIFDITGKRVADVVQKKHMNSGPAQIVWDGKNSSRQPVGTGCYICQATINTTIVNRKIHLVK